MKKIATLLAIASLISFSFAPGSFAEDTAAPAPFLMDVPHFQEEAVAAGIDHQYTGGWEYFVGGGVASFDCNGDRKPDLMMAGGTSPLALYVNESETGGALKFKAKPINLSDKDIRSVLGVYPIDIDNDGYTDIVLLRLGENIILKGGPDCTFEKANRTFAFDGGKDWTVAFAATWEAGNKYPTLAFGNYVDRYAPGTPFGTCSDNVFDRPVSNDKVDYSNPLPLKPSYCTLSMLFTDWNHSGQDSLRVANDRQYYRGGQEQLWDIAPGRPPRQYTTAEGWASLKIWGMGLAEADPKADGRPEYFITSMGDNKLQELDDEADNDSPTYRDTAYEKGVAAYRPYTGKDHRPSTAWHAQFADINNDTNMDLFLTKGNVEAMPDFASSDPDNLLLGGFDGKFTEKGDEAGIALPGKGRGAVVEDFNNDGMLDILVVNRMQRAFLFRNLGAKTEWGYRPLGNWTEIELDNGPINHVGIGATINVRAGTQTQVQRVQIGGGHASGHVGFTHFGLGTNERAVVRVQWPDGEWSQPYRIFANQHVVIKRGATSAKYWFAPPGNGNEAAAAEPAIAAPIPAGQQVGDQPVTK
ncbi:CRTAC1 family protein [Rhizobium sp. CB3171]|uniref:CRTAC1 family protein n=1 Tax=Rhizobium sp. CB3171 TaxID=3039157 RepID=UPI0024B0AE94|nr:CRTAC1 family protein [Rhizobium sp. CB3171]WFU00664.1 CRTAC1 family protein [Rhizobium sp. CB3171]